MAVDTSQRRYGIQKVYSEVMGASGQGQADKFETEGVNIRARTL